MDNNIFKKSKREKKIDIINTYFKFENIEDEHNIEENYFSLKRNLLLFPELQKDLLTVQLILSLYLYFANSLINNKQEIRNLIKDLIILLKNHDTFRYFLYNNNIDDNILLKLIPHLKYEHFTKNKFIIKQGEDSLNMYFVLKGNISLLKNSNKINEINIIKENENFGQWEVIYYRKRKLSYYSLDNCHVISISKDIIKKYLQDKLIKGKEELKSFVTKFCQNNGVNALYRIEKIINNLKVLHFRNEEIIYNEGEVNKNIYLVYKGEAKLVKNIKEGEFHVLENLKENILKIQEKAKNLNYKELIPEETDNEISNKNNFSQKKLMEKSEYKVLTILGKGSIGGAEISTGIINKKYTLVANSDYTSIIKIDLRYIKENINKFLQNLLPIFIQLEKDIHLRFKQIKYLDNLIPENCQTLKLKKDIEMDNSLNPLNNDQIFINEIKKINQKFEINEGGFIKINDFNIDLNSKKNKLKQQLIESKKKYIRLTSLIKKYDEKEEFFEKYKGVKMIKPNFINDNENKMVEENDDISQKNKFFILRKNNNSAKLIKNKSEKYFAGKTLENFEKIIENYRKRKEFLVIDIYNPQDIKTERNKESKKIIKSLFKEKKLLKEIIIIEKRNKRNEKYIEEYKTNYNNRIKSGNINKYNEKRIRLLNIYKAFNDKGDNKICIVNQNILRRLFEKNMIKNKRKKSSSIKYNTFSKKRMIYYNTGMYDMPFVSQLKLKI